MVDLTEQDSPSPDAQPHEIIGGGWASPLPSDGEFDDWHDQELQDDMDDLADLVARADVLDVQDELDELQEIARRALDM